MVQDSTDDDTTLLFFNYFVPDTEAWERVQAYALKIDASKYRSHGNMDETGIENVSIPSAHSLKSDEETGESGNAGEQLLRELEEHDHQSASLPRMEPSPSTGSSHPTDSSPPTEHSSPPGSLDFELAFNSILSLVESEKSDPSVTQVSAKEKQHSKAEAKLQFSSHLPVPSKRKV